MASSTTAKRLLSRFAMRLVNWVPASTNKLVVDLDPTGNWEGIPIARLKRLCVGLLLGNPSATPIGGVTEFEIVVATDDDITANVTVVKASTIFGGATPAAVGDTLWLEADVGEMREVLAAATHVGVRAKFGDAQDIAAFAVIEERIDEYDGLTADFDA